MEGEELVDRLSSSSGGSEKVSGAAAFKPTTTAELNEIKERKNQNRKANKGVSDEKQQQHIRKKLLAACQGVLSVNYEWLELDEYPDNRAISFAKRNRDFWLFSCCLEFVVLCAGVLGLAPAWVGGTAFGLLFLTLCFSFKRFRHLFSQEPTLGELLQERKKLEFRALNHIRLLEGSDGLAWKCRTLVKYNSNLERKLFQGLMDISAKKKLFSVIRKKKHIRLYLQLVLEAERAYKRLQKEYLKQHFKNLDNGVDDTVTEVAVPDTALANQQQVTVDLPDDSAADA